MLRAASRIILKKGRWSFFKRCSYVLTSAGVLGIPVLTSESRTAIENQRECLKYVCLQNVNAASALLTSSTYALERVAERYKKALSETIVVIEECILVNDLSEDAWDMVIALRAEGNNLKEEYNNLLTNMETVQKVVTSVIEISFNLNADHLCTTLCEHNTVATDKLRKIEKDIQKIEQEHLLALVNIAKIKQPKEE